MSRERFEAGLAVRREVLGAEYVDKAIAGADSFNREFQEFATEFCWGGTWARGVLERKTRSMLNLCMLSALNRPHEFKLHFRGRPPERLHARRAEGGAAADHRLLRGTGRASRRSDSHARCSTERGHRPRRAT